MILKLFINDPKIEFQPEFKQIEKIILNCFNHILKSAEELPRVEEELFPFPELKKYHLRTIRSDELLFEMFVKRVMHVYEANKIGPHKYLETYKKFADFMNNKVDQETSAFLKNSENQLEDFERQINKFTQIKKEIILMLQSVPLNLYSIECNGLHESLKERVQKIKDRFIQFCIDHNRETNKQLILIYLFTN